MPRRKGAPRAPAEDICDGINPAGARGVRVKHTRHDTELWQSTEAQIVQVLRLAAQRIEDLKKDLRFKYVTVYKNQGAPAGQQFDHPTTQLTATTFVPRRVLNELRASRDFYLDKERCVFCDMLNQETRSNQRIVEMRGHYVVFCPFASRVPYEMWIMPRKHEAAFERTVHSKNANLHELAGVLRRTLQRVNCMAESFHMVLHTVPNTYQKSNILQYWKTVDEDYHWHIEVLPGMGTPANTYFLQDVYYTPIPSELAAERLRALTVK